MRSRPTEPIATQLPTYAAARYYGWMVARSRAIDKIIKELELAGVRDYSKQYERIFNRRVDALDYAHGLKPISWLRR